MGAGFLNLIEVECRAREVLDAPTYAFVAAGGGEERTLRRNREAFERWSLIPRVLIDVSQVSTRTRVLGQSVSMPALVAPMGMQRLVHPEGECAMAEGVAEADTIMCVSTVSSRSPAEIAASGAAGWYQIYAFRDPGLTSALIEQAQASGYRALVLTVDGPVIGRRERVLSVGFQFPEDLTIPSCGPALGMPAGVSPAALADRNDRTLSWDTLAQIAAQTRLPLILKGILSPDDAALACEHGVAGVIVSNHGGRQLDGTPATLDVLEAVVQATAGRAEVLLDGGIRRGTDVLTALALGARAVLVGRPAYWGLAVDGPRGVARVLELLRAEIEQALILLGCRSPADVTRAHLLAAPQPQAGRRWP